MTPSSSKAARSLVHVALSALTQWRILVIWLVLTLVPTAVFCLPIGRFLASHLDHSAHVSEWAGHFDPLIFGDLLINAYVLYPVFGSILLVSVLLLLLVWPFLTGMVVAAAKGNRAQSFYGLIQGGFAEYGRMLRTLIWSLVPLGIAGAAGGALLHAVAERAESAILESAANDEMLLARIVLGILVVVALASVDAGRAQFVLDGARRSAIRAWWRGVRLVIRRPVATLGTYALITAVGLAVAGVLGLARVNVPHVTFPGFLLAFLLTELIAATLICTRIARLMVLVQIGRAQPLAGAMAGARTLH